MAQVKKVSLTATQAVRTTRKFILRILFEDSTSPQAKCLFKAPTHHAQVYPDSVDKKDDKKSLEESVYQPFPKAHKKFSTCFIIQGGFFNWASSEFAKC